MPRVDCDAPFFKIEDTLDTETHISHSHSTYRFTPRSTRVCVRVLTANSRLVGTFHGTFEVVT